MAGKDTARLQGKFAVQVKPNRLAIVLAVGAACVIAGGCCALPRALLPAPILSCGSFIIQPLL